MIKLKDLLTENKVVEYKFSDIRDFEQAENVLSKAGWYENGQGNPPSSKQMKKGWMYTPDEHWYTIKVSKKAERDIERIFDKNNIDYNKSYKKSVGYDVIDHGGYLD